MLVIIGSSSICKSEKGSKKLNKIQIIGDVMTKKTINNQNGTLEKAKKKYVWAPKKKLENARHECIARGRASGLRLYECYDRLNIGKGTNRSNTDKSNHISAIIRRNKQIPLRIQYLVGKRSANATYTAEEKRKALKIIGNRTIADFTNPDGTVDMEKLRDLKGIKSFKVSTQKGRDGKEVDKVEIVPESPLAAIQIDNKMSGHNAPDVSLVEFDNANAINYTKEAIANMSASERKQFLADFIKGKKAHEEDLSVEADELEDMLIDDDDENQVYLNEEEMEEEILEDSVDTIVNEADIDDGF